MPDYICKLGTEGGEIIEKRYAADNQDELRLELQQKGFYVFNIRQVGLNFLFGGGRRKRIKLDDFIIFNQELRALLAAGLPATSGLDILISRQGDSQIGKMLQDVKESIITGASISEAFAAHKERLPVGYVTTLIAGERSGDLAGAIDRFVKYAKLTNALRKNFRKALYYPAFLLLLAGGMIAMLMLYVLPEFSKFYEGFDSQLPGLTVFVMNVSGFLRDRWLLLLIAVVAAVIVISWWRRSEYGSRMWAHIVFAIPLVGGLYHKYLLAQTMHSLAVMLHGGMPLLSCLEDLEQSAANPLFHDALNQAKTRVSEGETLTGAIAGTTLDTELTAEMMQVGESTGSLPEMLSSVGDFYDEEVQNRTESLLSLLEPVLLLMMAVVVGTLLFAMYYPLFELLGSIGTGY
jgi:type IV pilus assembly protein PilC